MVVVILGAGFPTQRQFGIDGQQPILLLAAAGYTVFIPNDRSRGGISPRGYEQLGVERTYFSKPWRDAMQGVDLMVAKGLADPARIGIMGNSYGGGLVGWGITQTTRFKAAILKEPVALDMAASWRSIWGHKGFGGDAIGKQYGIDNPYEGEGKKFIEYESPITNVSAVRTPTLLEFGVKSGSVQFGGNEFFQALTWFGVPAELVMYPRTIHGFVEPKLVADSFRRELRWFGQYLPPNPP
jgi:dipeptidyl aminopeptidase/acylaminoacyl peptidase